MSVSEPPEGPRRPPLTPALAMRVAIVGSLTLALFAIIFFRLWFLQVLSGDQYVKEAAHNRTRSTLIAPKRGEILGQNGTVLVDSNEALAVKIVPSELPVKVSSANITRRPARRDRRIYTRLAGVLKLRVKPKPCTIPAPPPSCNTTTGSCPHSTTLKLSQIACTIDKQIAIDPYADVTVKQPVDDDARDYIDERQSQYTGVQVQQVSETSYPFGSSMAPQVLGTVGQITPAEHSSKADKGVNQNAIVGQTGLEKQYDDYLRGTFGKQQTEIDSAGQPVQQGKTIQPKAGDNLVTSLDANVQRVGQSALTHAIDTNEGLGGAFVAMDPTNGDVYAMGSYPYFNPNAFSKAGGISEKQYKQITGAGSDDPLFNRAIQSVAPDGSTFKVITATAALEAGDWLVNETFDDDADFHIGAETLQNSGGAHYGEVNLEEAIKVSDDEFFYNLGAKTNVDVPKGGPIQTWARKYGIGQKTGIDLPYESKGTLPDPAWRAQRNKDEQQCEDATGAYKYSRTVDGTTQISATPKTGYHRSPKHASCGIADGLPWTVGDNVNLAVGQGDLQLSPLQLAVVYSALANNGTIVTPHIGQEITNSDGTVLQKIASHNKRKLNINPIYLSAIQTGLHEAAQGGGPLASPGTSQTVMQSFGEPVYAKTGTAQYIPTSGPRAGEESDYAWYAAYVPPSATSKPIVVIVWVEGGGFGAIASAPVARQIMSEWFYDKPGPWIPGDSDDQ